MTLSPTRRGLLLALTLVAATAALAAGGTRATGQADAPVAAGFDFVKYPAPQPACAGVALRQSPYFTRADCGYGEVTLEGVDAGAQVRAVLRDAAGGELVTVDATHSDGALWQYDIVPAASWGAGPVSVTITVGGQPADGEGTFFLNQLGAELAPVEKAGGYRPGDDIPVTGEVFELRSVATDTQRTGVPAAFKLRVVDSNGAATATTSTITAASDGAVEATIPGSATEDLSPGRATNYRETVSLQLVDASYEDPSPLNGGGWGAWDGTAAGSATVSVPPTEPVLENSFVSSVGWVKPGDEYPFTVRVKNFRAAPVTGAQVAIGAPDGTTLIGDATWNAGTIPAADADGSPGVKEKVFEARADTLGQDPQIVWKDLSSTATLTYDGGADDVAQRSHGPKVIPPSGGYETSRYGDRPFPVVPVDYSDRAHGDGSSASRLAGKINDPEHPGSTFNLYQEMSYGQLFPNGTVPSAGIATAGWSYGPGFTFTQNSTDANTCHGVTNATLPGDAYQQIQPERIRDGWYQLPGSTDYYGDDSNGSALIGAVAGVGALQDIDSACGPTGKAVYDAAQIADPEIDYNEYDTDKDGVVDFFMMVFAGIGGNGASQTQVPPYDNIWPHSSDLQGAYADPATGEKGYVSDDQLTDLEGRPLYYTDASRTQQTTEETDFPVHVRVGPYNVNPESAIEKASVISHEYGHSLGLPDYYSTGSRETYGSWTLMATDYSQNIDIVGKKELGWVVPRVLEPGTSIDASDWRDTKVDTDRIDWKQPDGTPYALEGDDVANGRAYTAALPRRQVLDPALVPSGERVFWSGSGNDFGCTPQGAHNLDIALPGLADVPAGTPVTLTFKSRWDIEWDYDYGFVLTTTDTGKTYTSRASAKGYTTAGSQNPNANGCQSALGNGLTGSSGSYAAGTQTVDRVAGTYPAAPFVDDEYDLSDLAGKASVLRLSYATDPGLARAGWFVDDLQVKAGDRVIYSSDFESATDGAIYNGGCREGLQTAQSCTDGWVSISAADGSPAEHAYLMEMRDRSGFDAHGRNESERGDVTFAPGLLLAYTDETHGYGNVGTDDPPAQSPLDSQPEPGSETPNLDDAAFTAAAGDSQFSDGGAGHVDNYTDPASADGQWRFGYDCLAFDVSRMEGQDVDDDARNLVGDVAFTTGSGCGPFDYGTTPGGGADGAPTAVAQARPTTAQVDQLVSFDGSGSFDDRDAPEGLGYAWDFESDGSGDATTREARHAYAAPGLYIAKLTVRDSGGKTGSATVRIAVTGPPARPATPVPGGGGSGACATVSAFKSLRVKPKGGGLRFTFTRRRSGRVVAEVFRAAKGTTVSRLRRIARFTNRRKAFTYDGRGAVAGTYFTRVSLRANGQRLDTRRTAFTRAGGRFTRRRAFALRDGCGTVRAFKLERPVFGGPRTPLRVSFKLAERGRARIDLLRGRKVVRRVSSRIRTGLRTHRLKIRPRTLARGEYTVRLKVGKVTRKLSARRL